RADPPRAAPPPDQAAGSARHALMRAAGAALRSTTVFPACRCDVGARAPVRPLARRDIPARFDAFSRRNEKRL
ncbi:hypothetical protein, partial [Burkholderia sp. Ac-20392]|uniref:hypothetical protein n=1 Tax=Burkholderia sp. Ac-20392 TaxID=2703905 RepID=UPI00198239FA